MNIDPSSTCHKLMLTCIPVLLFSVFFLWLAGCSSDTNTPEGTPGEDFCTLTGKAPDNPDPTILFGDLHAHTSNSFDGQLVTLPLFGRRPYGPDDACEYARYCANLDFWSVNDHAEEMMPEHWRDNIDSIRQCNQKYKGYSKDPDMVSFVGWEWTQSTNDRDTDYGHHNVVLKDTCTSKIPDRPIAAPASFAGINPELPPTFRDIIVGIDPEGSQQYDAAIERAQDFLNKPACDPDTPTQQLPSDCHEVAQTPADLYDKLAQWGLEAIAIPHGTAWGTHHPQLVTWRTRFNAEQLSEHWSPVVEIHSGHGNSEEYRSWRHAHEAPDGSLSCPPPTDDFTLCCWRAGEIIREQTAECQSDPTGDTCIQAVAQARQAFLAEGKKGFSTISNATADDWRDCGQCDDCFLPDLGLRPERSVQAALAMTNFEDLTTPWRYQFGFASSTDSHQSGPGAGYKEFTEMTDSSGPAREEFESILELAEALITRDHTRQDSFNYGGGLIAVHTQARHRNAIWEAIQDRRVYATSGARIKLWFQWMGNDTASPQPMGSDITTSASPTFEVRALGAFKQAPGCPQSVHDAKSPEFISEMCFGECYNPTSERYTIDSIEVVKVTPQINPEESLGPLIQDPWKTFDCSQEDPDVPCAVQFTDDAYESTGRPSTYYGGHFKNPLRCSTQTPCGANETTMDNASTPTHAIAPTREKTMIALPKAWSEPGAPPSTFILSKAPQVDFVGA